MPSPTPGPAASAPATSLSARYVYAATRPLPEAQRRDVADELRGSIADRIDALGVDRPELDADAAERLALAELGDPVRLAAGYSGHRLQMIGPDLYPAYQRVLRGLLTAIVPTVTIVVALVDVVDDEPIGALLGGAAWTAVTLTVQVMFWVTVAFVLVGRGAGGPEAREALGVTWTPDRLPELPRRRGSLSDLVATLGFLAVFAGLIVWQQIGSPLEDDDGRSLPILDPDLWSLWLPLFLLLLVAEGVFAVVAYRAGDWSTRLAVVNVVVGAGSTAVLVFLAATDRLLDPEAVLAIRENLSGFDVDTVNVTIVVVALAVWVWDGVDGFRKAWASSDGDVAGGPPPGY